jgi:hypothetical protein
LGRSGVAGGEARLVEADRVRLVVAELGVETTTVRSEDGLDALGRTACDVGDLGASGGRQRLEDERAAFALADVDAVLCGQPNYAE